MPEYPIMDTLITSLNAQEPWPDNVKLFQPYEVEQILLPDNASCLAVQAFLKMCNLPFEVEMRWNAEFMSPSGRVPFIKCGAFVVSELEPIVQFAANKGVSLCTRLSTEEKAEMRAYMSLITNVLVNAELYISWLDNDTYNAVTKVRNASVYPWPLGWLQTRAKRNMVAKRLKALHWQDKTLEQVLADVEQCCNSLSQRLGDKDFFFGNTPTPLDALVYGHVRALLSASGSRAPLMIKPVTSSLLRHLMRMVNLTHMKLTLSHRHLSPERSASDRCTRVRRSRLSTRNPSRDSVYYNRDVFGFKPFASKQIIIMASKEGIQCNPDDNPQYVQSIANHEQYEFVVGILNDVIDKAEDVALEDCHDKIDADERNDFEVIVCPVANGDVKDLLDTIEEADFTDTTVTIEGTDDTMQILSDDDFDGDHEKLCDNELAETLRGSQPTDDSDNKYKTPIVTSIGGRISSHNMSVKSDNMPLTPGSGSKSTLKMPSNEEISVESLLNYLRKRNAAYNNFPDVDID